jgi:hypothetical protein
VFSYRNSNKVVDWLQELHHRRPVLCIPENEMTMDDWRRRLMLLQRAEREARAKLTPQLGPLESEQAYQALKQAEMELAEHYARRPAWAT